MVVYRTCKTCNETYPLAPEHFHRNGNGFSKECITCRQQKMEKYSYDRTKYDKKYNEKKPYQASRSHKTYYENRLSTLEGILEYRCSKAIYRAKRKNMSYNITPEYLMELWKKQEGKCYYSGLEMSVNANDFYTVSVDRIDSKKGYIKGNVALVCWSVNTMKSNFSVDEFIMVCKSIAAKAS